MNVKTITHGRYKTNTYVVDDGVSGEALLIDPTENPEGCIAIADSAGLRIVAIVSTHSHFDHVGGVAGVKERLGVPFMIGAQAVESLRQESARAHLEGVDIADPPEPDRRLKEGDSVDIGALKFYVYDTPGHWTGDICLYEPRAKAVFTGDSLHRGEIGRYNKGCNEAELVRSIQTKLLTLPDDTLVYSGHGPVTTIGEERRDNRGLKGLPLLK